MTVQASVVPAAHARFGRLLPVAQPNATSNRQVQRNRRSETDRYGFQHNKR